MDETNSTPSMATGMAKRAFWFAIIGAVLGALCRLDFLGVGAQGLLALLALPANLIAILFGGIALIRITHTDRKVVLMPGLGALLVGIYSNVMKGRLGHGRIGTLSVIEVIEGITTRISYQDFQLSGLKDGKTASITAGQIRMQSPSPDGLVNITVAGVEATDMDLGAMVHVYDPAQYGPDGAGDMIWRTIVGHAAYKGVEMELPGAKIALGDFSMDAFKARQPKHSFGPLLDKLVAHPEQSAHAMEDAAPARGSST